MRPHLLLMSLLVILFFQNSSFAKPKAFIDLISRSPVGLRLPPTRNPLLSSVKLHHFSTKSPYLQISEAPARISRLATRVERSDRIFAFNNTFVIPNEHEPQLAMPVFELLPSGTSYLSVGTERGFTGAALSKAEQLYLVDQSDGTVFFNLVNILLLKISNDRSDYVYLRESATREEWRERFLRNNIQFDRKSSEDDHFFLWEKLVRFPLVVNDKWGQEISFRSFHSGEIFKGVNYLFRDDLFAHLKKMADDNRIHVFHMNLASSIDVETLVKKIRENDTQLGIIDLSNIINIENYCLNKSFCTEFMSQSNFLKLLHTLSNSSIVHSEALYLATKFKRNQDRKLIFDYRAIPFSAIIPLDVSEFADDWTPDTLVTQHPQDWMLFRSEGSDAKFSPVLR